MRKAFFSRKWSGVFSALLVCAVLFSCGRRTPAFDTTITLYPEASRELSGYQNITIAYDPRRDVRIRDITADSGDGPRSILTAATHLRAGDGQYVLTWCAQCVQASQVNLAVSFEGDIPPIQRTYRLRARPVVNVAAQFNAASGAIRLDASESFSPAKKPLLFTWRTGQTSVAGLVFTAAASTLAKAPTALTVSDELVETNQLVTVELNPNGTPRTDAQGRPIKTYSEEQLQCTDLQIVNAGFSLINPSVQLGPDPAENQMIPVADGKVSRDYMVSHKFDIVATIAPHTENLREGQDVAVTTSFGGTVKKLKGKTRAVGDGAGVFGPEIEAGYPNPAPAGAPLNPPPPMVEDGYEAHPLTGLTYVNTATGVNGLYVKKKDFDSSKTKLVWFDQPILPLKAGTPIQGGGYKRMYVHVWLTPDRAKCEKYFTIEMEYDATGKVTKNKLTILN